MGDLILHTKNRLLEPKDFYSEVRCKKDIKNFLEDGLIILDMVENDIDKLLLSVIKKMVEPIENIKVFDDHLDNVILSSKVLLLKNSIQYFDENGNQADVLNQNWLFSNVDFPFIKKTHVAIVRMKNSEIYFGPNAKYVKMFVLVLSPLDEKRTKNSINSARTFATLFSSEVLRRQLLNAKSNKEVQLLVKNECEKRCKKNFQLSNLNVRNEKISPKYHFSMLRGLRSDLKNVVKYYKSDFVDIFRDRKSQLKALSTTIFLYFTCILPTLAFGSVNDKSTDGMIDAQKALIGQFLGGLIFALFSGQPLVIVATTAPLCLYTKIIMDFSASFQVDFYSMFAWVGIWNFIFLIIYSVLDLSILMKFSTRGIEEIFSTFIFFAFTLDALHDIHRLFEFDYNDCNSAANSLNTNMPFNNSTATFSLNYTGIYNESSSIDSVAHFCQKDRPILAIFLMLVTFWLANKLSNLSQTSLFTRNKREFISDYSLPIAILFFSLISTTVFNQTPKDEFQFSDTLSFQFANLTNLPIECILVCLGLGFSLSLLFFMDQNISAALIQTPENKLKKPNSYDWDLLLIGMINLVLSLFGFPFMHGILPHSPLHARNLAEIEYVIENGSIKEKVLFVRETRLTAILSHILIGLSLLMVPYPINLIPISVLDGLFLFCAFSTLIDNSFFDRIILFITEQKFYPLNDFVNKCPQRVMHQFTIIQIVELFLVCFFGFSPWPSLKMAFPVIIVLLMPFRKFVLPKIFTEKEINILDPFKH